MALNMKMLASALVTAVREHVAERLEPFDARIRAADAVIGGLHDRIIALEARLADAEAKLQLRRVA